MKPVIMRIGVVYYVTWLMVMLGGLMIERLDETVLTKQKTVNDAIMLNKINEIIDIINERDEQTAK